MFLESIQLMNFKNYEEFEMSFSKDINCVVGPNGVGKTNLLDAVYYLCMTKSAFPGTEQLNIKHEQQFFLNKGSFQCDDETECIVQCAYKKGDKKSVKLNKKEYEKLSQHIGRFPCVLMTPYDTDLVREGSESRRKFFDNTLSQTDSTYLDALIQHNHFLKQRNNLLKQFAEKRFTDKALLETYNSMMCPHAKIIHQKRSAFIDQFNPLFLRYYTQLGESKEAMSIAYKSSLTETIYEEILKVNLHKDLALQRTCEGIHKDDFIFSMGEFPLKKVGSQGQQKSFVIALKLAQYEWIVKNKGLKAILLLDDIFDKLDDNRIAHLLNILAEGDFGQIFISDARPERSEKLLDKIGREVKFFNIESILNKY
ncbi:DNA replication/repair protein RecF [Chondrinema litorale]|uniref:DNA replication/repair protein RecF n=1 Tax=Chondrinema litorale TaxID=2994555 RepID=UPI00254277C1|nr:DNA replication and repair protein RecF [Chondrinema litorale]UZR92263.1 DNA replication and repair protein RecF [Chondrinema litorale]